MPNVKILLPIVLLAGSGVFAEEGKQGFFQQPPSQQWPALLVGLTIVLAVALGLVITLSVFALLRPDPIRRIGDRLRVKLWQSPLAGALAAAVFLLGFAVFDKFPAPLKDWCGLAWVLPLVYWLLRGLAGLAHELGDRALTSLGSRLTGSVFAATAAGGLLLVGLGLLPFVGQALHFLILLTSLGVSILTLRK